MESYFAKVQSRRFAKSSGIENRKREVSRLPMSAAASVLPLTSLRHLTTASDASPVLRIEEEDDGEQILAAASEAVRLRVAMDSAAVEHVIQPCDLAADVEYVPNTSGRHFIGANDAHIEK